MIAISKHLWTGDDRHSSMIQTISQMAGFMSNPRQVEYWNGLASCARPVRVVRASEVWSDDKVKLLKRAVRPAKKECYRVAALLSRITNGQARYVEGQLWAIALGVDHAFNYIPEKDVCVDFTVEFALGKDPAQEAYIAFRDFDDDVVWNIIQKNEYYGNIYNEVWLSEHSK